MSNSFYIKTDLTDEVLVAKNEAVIKALRTIALKAEGYAKGLCPVDTGNLRGSITGESDGNSVQVGTNVEYAKYVEAGTYKMKARPYVKPSIEDHVDEYQEIFKRILEGGSQK